MEVDGENPKNETITVTKRFYEVSTMTMTKSLLPAILHGTPNEQAERLPRRPSSFASPVKEKADSDQALSATESTSGAEHHATWRPR